MAEKKVTRIVAHPKLYLSVGGKLQHVKKGTEVTVTASQAKAMGDKLIDGSQVEKLDTTTKDGIPGGEAAESEAIKQLTTDLEAADKASSVALSAAVAETERVTVALGKTATDLKAANAETKKAQDALVKTATDLEAAKKEVKALKAAAKK